MMKKKKSVLPKWPYSSVLYSVTYLQYRYAKELLSATINLYSVQLPVGHAV